ncbi:MAG: aldo/keto reductase [Desulfohalobiaceae bacterium]|nr:aldo/keto reductase [Desulfohalobiaceae bacterium]
MPSIQTNPFGSTGHMSTRIIFGSFAVKDANQDQAASVLDLLYDYGINHIDTAPGYGDAELRVGEWMEHHRSDFFLATKIDVSGYRQAKEQLQRSLDRLRVDSVDLLQLHNLTDETKREFVMAEGGALDYMVEAKAKGLTRYIGITGHGFQAPQRHLETLQRHAFDSVLAPCNYPLMQIQQYRETFDRLLQYCQLNGLPLQTIKSAARRKYPGRHWSHATWYEPLTDPKAIESAVQWVLGIPDVFVISTGDLSILPHILNAAALFKEAPPKAAMRQLVAEKDMMPLFT